MSARWYKRCGADFIHGTMMLTLEEKGAYSLCLDLIYDRGGPIPDDARWLAGVCGVSIRKWTAIRERLILLGKIASEGGHISNSRADLELVSSELQARKLSESGAKGGRKRAENAGQPNKSNDLAEASLKLTREEKSREEYTPNGVLRESAVKHASVWVCPEGVEPDHWRDFLANRKTKRLTNSPTAYRGQIAQLAKLSDEDWPPGRLVEHAAAKGWGSINDPRTPMNGGCNGTQRSLERPRTNPLSEQYRAICAAASSAGDEDFDGAGPALPAPRYG